MKQLGILFFVMVILFMAGTTLAQEATAEPIIIEQLTETLAPTELPAETPLATESPSPEPTLEVTAEPTEAPTSVDASIHIWVVEGSVTYQCDNPGYLTRSIGVSITPPSLTGWMWIAWRIDGQTADQRIWEGEVHDGDVITVTFGPLPASGFANVHLSATAYLADNFYSGTGSDANVGWPYNCQPTSTPETPTVTPPPTETVVPPTETVTPPGETETPPATETQPPTVTVVPPTGTPPATETLPPGERETPTPASGTPAPAAATIQPVGLREIIPSPTPVPTQIIWEQGPAESGSTFGMQPVGEVSLPHYGVSLPIVEASEGTRIAEQAVGHALKVSWPNGNFTLGVHRSAWKVAGWIENETLIVDGISYTLVNKRVMSKQEAAALQPDADRFITCTANFKQNVVYDLVLQGK